MLPLVPASILLALALMPWLGTAQTGPPARAAGATPTEAEELLRRVVQRHASLQAFQARFQQTALSRATGRGRSEGGVVSYRRPDLWRWEYETPEHKVVWARGRRVALWVEGDKEVVRYDLSEAGSDSAIGALLGGSTEVDRAFRVRFASEGEGAAAEEPVLRLEPRDLREDFDHAVLRLRRRDLLIVEALIVDPGGNGVEFEFSRYRFDASLPDGMFEPPDAVGEAPSREP